MCRIYCVQVGLRCVRSGIGCVDAWVREELARAFTDGGGLERCARRRGVCDELEIWAFDTRTERERERERQTDRQTDRQTERERERHTHTHTHTLSLSLCLCAQATIKRATDRRLLFWPQHQRIQPNIQQLCLSLAVLSVCGWCFARSFTPSSTFQRCLN